MKTDNLRVVETFPSVADAQIAKGILDEVGIDSMVRTDDGGGMFPAIGGAQLLVRAEDVDNATAALHRRHSHAHHRKD